MPLVSGAIDQQRYLLNNKFVDVDIETLAEPVVHGHPQAFFITVNNLVRNAFEQTLAGQGPVTFLINANELRVSNRLGDDTAEQNGFAEASPSHGYGLGLGIVQRLCERHGWSFSLNADAARVTACLAW